MIATSLFLNTQKGNVQGLHFILTNHIDYFGVSVLYRQNPEHTCSSKVSPLTTKHIYIFCFVLPMAVQFSLVVLYSVFMLAKLVMDSSIPSHNSSTTGLSGQHLPWHNYDLEYFTVFQPWKL